MFAVIISIIIAVLNIKLFCFSPTLQWVLGTAAVSSYCCNYYIIINNIYEWPVSKTLSQNATTTIHKNHPIVSQSSSYEASVECIH